MQEESQFLTMREAADLLRCTERNIARHKANGRLPWMQLGSFIRFERKDVLALLKPAEKPHFQHGRFAASR
jgi:excisionase family DNA binding protein